MTVWRMDQQSLIPLQTLTFIAVHTLLSKVGLHFHPQRGFLPSQVKKRPSSPRLFVQHTSSSGCFPPWQLDRNFIPSSFFLFFLFLTFWTWTSPSSRLCRHVSSRFSLRSTAAFSTRGSFTQKAADARRCVKRRLLFTMVPTPLVLILTITAVYLLARRRRLFWLLPAYGGDRTTASSNWNSGCPV